MITIILKCNVTHSEIGFGANFLRTCLWDRKGLTKEVVMHINGRNGRVKD